MAIVPQGSSQPPNFLARLWANAIHYWPTIIGALSSLAMAWAAAVPSLYEAKDWKPYGLSLIRAFWAGAAGSVIALSAVTARQRRLDSAEKELSEARRKIGELTAANARLDEMAALIPQIVFAAISYMLADVGKSFGIDNHCRISLYKHEGDHFVLLGRYAAKPLFHKRTNLRPYPEDEGCIGEAWAKGEHYVQDLPDPTTNLEGYVTSINTKYKIDAKTVRGFKMKSRCYFGKVLMDHAGQHQIAVLVVESTQPRGLSTAHMASGFKQTEGQLKKLASDAMRDLMPDISIAKEAGF